MKSTSRRIAKRPQPKTIEELDQIATLKEVASILKVSAQEVANWIEDGSIDAIDIAGAGSSKRHFRICTNSLREFLNRRKHKGAFA